MGGPNNPPDRPYQVITLDTDDQKASAQLQLARDAGATEIFGFSNGRVIMGHYSEKKNS